MLWLGLASRLVLWLGLASRLVLWLGLSSRFVVWLGLAGRFVQSLGWKVAAAVGNRLSQSSSAGRKKEAPSSIGCR